MPLNCTVFFLRREETVANKMWLHKMADHVSLQFWVILVWTIIFYYQNIFPTMYMHFTTNGFKRFPRTHFDSIGRRNCERIMQEKTPLSYKLCAFRCHKTRHQLRSQIQIKLRFGNVRFSFVFIVFVFLFFVFLFLHFLFFFFFLNLGLSVFHF